ncbi:MAG: hypothetical protein M1824_004306 [Vezdaea acicularis]|nr:MAG: hypothetical protein M1824_004306 [Vezdaea acicularis]
MASPRPSINPLSPSVGSLPPPLPPRRRVASEPPLSSIEQAPTPSPRQKSFSLSLKDDPGLTNKVYHRHSLTRDRSPSNPFAANFFDSAASMTPSPTRPPRSSDSEILAIFDAPDIDIDATEANRTTADTTPAEPPKTPTLATRRLNITPNLSLSRPFMSVYGARSGVVGRAPQLVVPPPADDSDSNLGGERSAPSTGYFGTTAAAMSAQGAATAATTTKMAASASDALLTAQFDHVPSRSGSRSLARTSSGFVESPTTSTTSSRTTSTDSLAAGPASLSSPHGSWLVNDHGVVKWSSCGRRSPRTPRGTRSPRSPQSPAGQIAAAFLGQWTREGGERLSPKQGEGLERDLEGLTFGKPGTGEKRERVKDAGACEGGKDGKKGASMGQAGKKEDDGKAKQKPPRKPTLISNDNTYFPTLPTIPPTAVDKPGAESDWGLGEKEGGEKWDTATSPEEGDPKGKDKLSAVATDVKRACEEYVGWGDEEEQTWI